MNYDVTLPETDQSFKADLSVVIKGDKGDKGDAPVRGVDYWTDADKDEIVAEAAGFVDAVLYTEQTLAEEQKAQARENIGSASQSELDRSIANQNETERKQAQHLDVFYDFFWDTIQEKGNRTNYCEGFKETKHTKETFKPKYSIRPTGDATGIFQNVWVYTEEDQIDMRELEEEFGIQFDFSQVTAMRFAFFTNLFKSLSVIDVSNATTYNAMQYCFYAYGYHNANIPKLQTIDKIISSENTKWTANSFGYLVGLKEVTFEGVIGVAFNISPCSLLSSASVQSIIDALKDLTGATSKTLTFHNTVGKNLTNEQKAAITAKNWSLVY